MQKYAFKLHDNIPPGYYLDSIKRNPFQRFWHLRRFKNVGELIPEVKGAVLDIGSSDGTFTEIIAEKSKADEVVGIDIVKSSVDYARRRFCNTKKFNFMVADGEFLPFEKNSFSAVFCLEALEHVVNPKRAVCEMNRVLCKGGYLIVLVPTDSLLFRTIWWVVLRTWGKHWKETHVNSFNNKNPIGDFIKKQGFHIEVDKKFLHGMLEVVRAKKLQSAYAEFPESRDLVI